MFDRLLCTPLGLQETKQQRLCEVKKLLPLYFIFQRNFLTSSFYLTSPLQQLLGNLKKRWCCSTINQDFKKLSRFILFFKIITPLYWVGRGVFRTLQNICDGAFYDVIFLKKQLHRRCQYVSATICRTVQLHLLAPRFFVHVYSR